MKTTLALLVASTALAAAIGVPGWSAMDGSAEPEDRSLAAAFDAERAALPLIFVSNDDDDDRRYRDTSRRAHGDDDEDHDDDEDGDDDDDANRGGARNPAPAGTVAPPANGLFGNDAPPQVKVN